MPYLGNDPGAITDAFTDTFTGDASETNFTLTRASTTNSVFVRISGVMQRNGADFDVDGVTLTIGAYLTILLDRLIIDVLCWMPEDSTGNVGLTPGGQQEEEVEVDTDGDDAHNVHMFLQFDAVSASQEQRNAFLIEGEANGENTIDHEEENVHLAY